MRDAFLLVGLVVLLSGFLVMTLSPFMRGGDDVHASTPIPTILPTQTTMPTGLPDAVEGEGQEERGEPAERLSQAFPVEIQRWKDLIERYAREYNLDPDLVGAVIYVESWFPPDYAPGYTRCPDGAVTPSCTSRSGAIGIMQVMPFHFKPGEDGRDPETNIRKGCAILRYSIDKMGTIEDGLRAYYAGVNGAKRGEGYYYADKVLNAYNQFKD